MRSPFGNEKKRLRISVKNSVCKRPQGQHVLGLMVISQNDTQLRVQQEVDGSLPSAGNHLELKNGLSCILRINY